MVQTVINTMDSADLSRRKKVAVFFKSRQGFFFKKGRLAGESYKARIVDPFLVFGESYATSRLHLVGDNWLDADSQLPVAYLWGFNNWKLGFVSDYLAKDYRTVFAPRKLSSLLSVRDFKGFPIRPSVLIVWGQTEPWFVRKFAELRKIPIFRMEDGFLRSANLGASHSTPYSLVLDSSGIHYDPSSESDLERILNETEFDANDISQARECLTLLRTLNLSKYNPPTFGRPDAIGIKTKRRVAVIGQVDNDKSVKLGNTNRWSMKELIQLAKMENPDAEVIYRPHPDVYKGYQRSKFRARSVDSICTVSDPDIPMADFLDLVDHVYTITSLTGLEALLRGIKVTVVGAAFYAGWGLTDDRVAFPRQRRQRSLEELVAGVYLKYPRYLANLEDSLSGFKSACLAIKVDSEVGKYQAIRALPALADTVVKDVAQSPHWPQVVLDAKFSSEHEALISQIDFGAIFSSQPGKTFQIGLCYAICGACETSESRDRFLTVVRTYIDPSIFGELLSDLSRVHPGQYIAKQYAWLLTSLRNPVASLDVLAIELENNVRARSELARVVDAAQFSPALRDEISSLHESSDDAALLKLAAEQADLQLEIFEYQFNLRKFDEALTVAKELLIRGQHTSRLLPFLAELAETQFDYSSAQALARFAYYQGLVAPMASIEARTVDPATVLRDPWPYLTVIAKIATLRPGKIAFCMAMLKRFEDKFDYSAFERLLVGVLNLKGEHSVGMAQALMAIERPEPAVRMMEDLIDAGDNSPNTRIAYSQALSYAGRLGDALNVMHPVLKSTKTSMVFREALRLYILAGDYDAALSLVRDAKVRRIDIGEMLPRKVYFGARMPAEALSTFTELQIVKTIRTYYPEKYLPVADIDESASRLALLAIFGPGDELRFSSIYNSLPRSLPNKKISVTCDPRLKSLFERSFSHLEFVGVPRLRDSDRIDIKDYSRVPGSDICYIVNNVAADKISECERLMVVTDLLHKCLPGYQAFTGTPYLKADPALQQKFRERLPHDKKLVGLSWRSSITTHSRNEHYLSVDELEAVFSIEGVQFVNFQYDECSEELDWIEARYPGKVLNFSDIDQFNDFESVAALMKCMDLMIAPATTVVELAGALGCETWLLSNSSELHWRKINSAGTDVWHHSILHVEGQKLGDKESLVQALTSRLGEYVLNIEELPRIA